MKMSIARKGNPLVDACVEAFGLEKAEIKSIRINMDAHDVITATVEIYVDVEGLGHAIRDLTFKAVDPDGPSQE